MGRSDWHKLQVYLALAATMRRVDKHAKQVDHHDYQFRRLDQEIGNVISGIRGDARNVVTKPKVRDTAAASISGAIARMYHHKRSSFQTTVGGNHVSARKEKTRFGTTIKLQVGYMWEHKVYERFYRASRLPYDDWLVLKAEEVRVNVPDARIYVATAYSFPRDKVQEVFIGQSMIGKQRASIKLTLNAAIEAAHEHYRNEIDATITGDENADGSKTA